MSFATIYLNPNLINTDEEHFKKLSISSISVSFRLLMVLYRKYFYLIIYFKEFLDVDCLSPKNFFSGFLFHLILEAPVIL